MAAARSPIRVLIVDDDGRFRWALRALFEAEGFSVVGEARNGAEAIALALELRPDVITMDMEMPVMNGVDATRAICSESGHPTVVVVSGSDSSKHLDAALAAGARWHIEKGRAATDLAPILRAAAAA